MKFKMEKEFQLFHNDLIQKNRELKKLKFM